MSKTGFFLLKTTFRDNYDIEDAANDIEQMAEAKCIDYVWLGDLVDANDTPYIAY
tara:strand:+ start:74 stop:238 length:165 start_codon:yes stop_codon:yes gene_type:complete